MNSNAVVLLDTSIQIERMMGALAQQEMLESHLALKAHRFVSTHYVFMEFQRAVLSDYVRVYHALLQHRNWEDAAYALRSGPLAYRARALGRCLHILTQIMSASSLRPAHALETLQLHIQFELPARFWRQVEPLPNAIGCDLVTAGVKRHAQRFIIADSCRKEEATCHLPDFLADHRVELQSIAAYLVAHPQVVKEQTRLERLVRTVIDDPRTALGQSSCWPLGDIIIALQALPDAQVWTIDADFQPIAQALGLSLYRPELSSS
jgi:hypothetical protein